MARLLPTLDVDKTRAPNLGALGLTRSVEILCEDPAYDQLPVALRQQPGQAFDQTTEVRKATLVAFFNSLNGGLALGAPALTLAQQSALASTISVAAYRRRDDPALQARTEVPNSSAGGAAVTGAATAPVGAPAAAAAHRDGQGPPGGAAGSWPAPPSSLVATHRSFGDSSMTAHVVRLPEGIPEGDCMPAALAVAIYLRDSGNKGMPIGDHPR